MSLRLWIGEEWQKYNSSLLILAKLQLTVQNYTWITRPLDQPSQATVKCRHIAFRTGMDNKEKRWVVGGTIELYTLEMRYITNKTPPSTAIYHRSVRDPPLCLPNGPTSQGLGATGKLASET